MASDLSDGVQQVAGSLSSTLVNPMTAASAEVATAAREPVSWLGFIGWLLYLVLNLISTLLYWTVRIVSISLPRLLYALFSTSWTVTMNATTLYARPRAPASKLPPALAHRLLACLSWWPSSRRPVGS